MSYDSPLSSLWSLYTKENFYLLLTFLFYLQIRGDLHACLMGDPRVAKSHVLKHMINVAPRGVYTTSRGSYGVGLIAVVQRDPVTNKMVLEGRALACF